MMLEYALLPFVAWFVTGVTKFCVNSVRAKSLALEQVGYGGFPSNHSSIVASICVYVALSEGLQSAAFGVAMTLAFIVIMDARSLRVHVGRQAEQVNALLRLQGKEPVLRERMGHHLHEVIGGVLLGGLIAWGWHSIFHDFTS